MDRGRNNRHHSEKSSRYDDRREERNKRKDYDREKKYEEFINAKYKKASSQEYSFYQEETARERIFKKDDELKEISSIKIHPLLQSIGTEKSKIDSKKVDSFLSLKPSRQKIHFDTHLPIHISKRKLGIDIKNSSKSWTDIAENFKKEVQEKKQKRALTEQSLASDSWMIEDFIKAEAHPDVEWWDLHWNEGISKITNLIQKPSKIMSKLCRPEIQRAPLKLTPKEQKKLRRQRRLENSVKAQEEIKLGLRDAPKDKVKIVNIPKIVDGSIEPTQLEQKLRKEAEDRKKGHEKMNYDRKTEAKREKQVDICLVNKMSIFKLNCEDFTQKESFKIGINAKQLGVYGILISSQKNKLLIAQSGKLDKFSKLLLNRMPSLNAQLLWEGPIEKIQFKSFRVELVQSAFDAISILKPLQLETFWR